MRHSSKGRCGCISSKQSKQQIFAAIESLEIRRLLATITVTSTADTITPGDGAVTLREAITALNAGSTTDTDITSQSPGTFGTNDAIHFNISGTGVQTIKPASNLPFISVPMTIDGYTQPSAAAATANTNATILIEIDGENAGNSDGLDIANIGVTIRGLDINRFIETGILMSTDSGSDVIAGNYIGTDPTGKIAEGNRVGIDVFTTESDTIGGSTAADRNVISANQEKGIDLESASDCVIEGNYIGTDATGLAALGNGNEGIKLFDSDNTTVGGTTSGQRNVISGNTFDGIHIQTDDNDTASGLIEGNYIGLDAAGTAALPNDNGITLNGTGPQGAANNLTIGGTAPGAGNVISGNKEIGIDLGGDGSGAIVQGNRIGTNAAGTAAIGNKVEGIFTDIPNTTIGGSDPGAGNIISGNGDSGIVLISNLNLIQGNLIGVLADGVTPAGNQSDGIGIGEDANQNLIGGSALSQGNIIANNGDIGVEITAVNQDIPTQNTVRLNSIYNNGSLGIDLDFSNDESTESGVTPNDPGDIDDGANDSQNFPVLVSANSTGSAVTVNGTFNSLADTTFTLDFYASDTIDPSGNGEGKQYIGSIGVITDDNGNASFNQTFNTAIGVNTFISSTASNTSTSPYCDTSEFSASVEAAPAVPPLPTLSINDVTQNEGNSGTTNFTFTVTRSGDTTGTSDVFYSTAGNTATSGTDFTAIPLTKLHFVANQKTATITVKVTGDTTVESNETFTVNLSTPTNATIADGSGTGTITNDDTAPPPPPASKVSIITDPCDSTKTAVEIDGTNNNDTIVVTKSGSAQGKVVVKINNVVKGTFSFTGSIVVHAMSGNDNVSIDTAITRQTFLFGEAGNDTLSGGGGSDVIVGGDGNDKISGNAGRDLLFGGNGSDSLNGGADDDLLDAGTTNFDTTIASLCKLQDEWVRTDKTYAQRTTDITNGGGLNGSVELNKNTTFSSTTLKDTLTGGTGNDLFFAASTGDVLSDKASGETVVKIG